MESLELFQCCTWKVLSTTWNREGHEDDLSTQVRNHRGDWTLFFPTIPSLQGGEYP